MCRHVVTALACLMLVGMCIGCTVREGPACGRAAAASPGNRMTVEQMTEEAQARYQYSVKEGLPKSWAADEAAAFLRGQEKVSEVRVLGPDSLRVVFTDGNDLIILLGKDRL